MPLQATSGAASYDGFGGGPAAVPNYIEECFATHLYTGNGSTQTITNGIDLSTKGGLVWTKQRSGVEWHFLVDTARGATKCLSSNATNAEATYAQTLTGFNSNGYSIGNDSGFNSNGSTYASWTFRKQPKFFDVVTYTGDGTSNRAISHSLGSAPGCIIAKRTDAVGNWNVYHRGVSPANDNTLTLNTTSSASGGGQDIWGNGVNVTTPTTTLFYVAGQNNNNGVNYVAYLFAHDAGGFGLTGTDNVISCGSFTVSGNAATVNLGYEPQWLLIKSAASVSAWDLFDSMRGLQVSGNQPVLNAQSSGAEFGTGSGVGVNVTSTGFATNGYLGNGNHIYIAIRRGPMKTPTTGTSVFAPVYATSAASPYTVTTNFPVDTVISANTAGSGKNLSDRLRGGTTTTYTILRTDNTNAESSGSGFGLGFQNNTAIIDNNYWSGYGLNVIYWNFRRAPGFFDVVCYTGNATSNTSISHNLTVIPELWIVKARNEGTRNWQVYYDFGASTYSRLVLNTTGAATTGLSYASSTNLYAKPTASALILDSAFPNTSAETYVAYLFASCPGVSKVGSYTGSGTTKQIDCGFTGGARFVLIKRTDSTGDWYCWDSSRGIVSGNDPYLLLNSTAAEVTNTDYIDTYSAGFEISSTAPAAINANGGSFVFLAIS